MTKAPSAGKYVLPLLAVALAAVFLNSVRDVLLPFILGGTLAYIVNPLIAYFEVRGWRRDRVVMGLYLLTTLAVAAGGYWVVLQTMREYQHWHENYPRYMLQLDKALVSIEAALMDIPYARTLLEKALANWESVASSILSAAPSILGTLLTLVFLVPFIGFFFMVGGPQMVDQVLDVFPSRYVEMALHIISEIDESLGNYLRGLVLEGLLVGLTAYAGLWLIGMDYAMQLSIIVGLTNMIPYVGPVVGGVVGSVLALVQFKTMASIFKVMVVFGGVQFMDNWVYQPVILEKAVEIHPGLILFALMAGEHLGGMLGMVFAVPVACMIKVCVQIGWEWYRTEYAIRPSPVPPEIHRVPMV